MDEFLKDFIKDIIKDIIKNLLGLLVLGVLMIVLRMKTTGFKNR